MGRLRRAGTTCGRLAYASEVTVSRLAPDGAEGMAGVVTRSARCFMPMSELVDLDQERERLTREIEKNRDSWRTSGGNWPTPTSSPGLPGVRGPCRAGTGGETGGAAGEPGGLSEAAGLIFGKGEQNALDKRLFIGGVGTRNGAWLHFSRRSATIRHDMYGATNLFEFPQEEKLCI